MFGISPIFCDIGFSESRIRDVHWRLSTIICQLQRITPHPLCLAPTAVVQGLSTTTYHPRLKIDHLLVDAV